MKRLYIALFLFLSVVGVATFVFADLQTSLVSCWKMDETSGTRVDSFGSNDLTDNNSAGFGTGIINNAVSLSAASTQYLSNASVSVVITTGISVSLWFKATSFDSNYDNLFSYRTGSGDFIEIYINSSEKLAVYCSTGGADGTGSTTFSTGSWYHVVVTLDTSNGLVSYVNGSVEQVNGSLSFIPGTTNNPLFIGRETTFDGRYFDGLIDEVGLWKKTLSSTEVSDLYNSGSAIACPFSGGPTPTSTPTNTPIPTATATSTSTPTPTVTATPTNTPSTNNWMLFFPN